MRLVHRDISPSNVFISRRGDVKLGDFGIAHAQERESKTQAGTLKGKYGYMSPEQVVGGSARRAQRSVRGRHRARRDAHGPAAVHRAQRSRRAADGARRAARSAGQVRRRSAARAGPASCARRWPSGWRERFQSAAEFRDALGDLLFKVGHAGLASGRGPHRRRLAGQGPGRRRPHGRAAAPLAGGQQRRRRRELGQLSLGRTPAPSNVGSGPAASPVGRRCPRPGACRAGAPARQNAPGGIGLARPQHQRPGPPRHHAGGPAPARRIDGRGDGGRGPAPRARRAPTWTLTWRRWTTSCPQPLSIVDLDKYEQRGAARGGRRRSRSGQQPPIWAR